MNDKSAPLYLDHNATTAPYPEVVQEMVDVLQHTWANPSSIHAPGQAARRVLADARARVAALLGCQPAELIFTSGATEANHMAVLGALAQGRASGRRRLVLSAVEHPGMLGLAKRLADEGTPVDLIDVDAQGRLNLEMARRLLGPDVALLSVMAANNETGVLMPLAELSSAARQAGVPFHVDATQALGKSGLRFAASGADLWSVSGHKIGGPKGIGALVVKKGLSWPALFSGRQERHRRGGTENLPGIAGFAAAADVTGQHLPATLLRLHELREILETGLLALHPSVQVLGSAAERLANTCCVLFGELDSERVLTRLERAGIVASSGAACSAGGTSPSHVLLAMGLSPEAARAGVRFSLGASTTEADIQLALQRIHQVLPALLADALPQPA